MRHHYASPALQDQKSLALALQTLNAKERQYVELRLQGALPNAAARGAGLEPAHQHAERLEKDERVRAVVEYSLRVKSHQMQITREDVLAGLMDATRMASTATELTGAWREIGKIIGAYEPTKIDVNVTKREQLETVSDEELAQLAAIEGEYQVLTFDENYSADEEGEPDDGA